jgi:hypothetical protein
LTQQTTVSRDQSSLLTYEGSFTLPDLCNGGTIRVGQPGQMLFAAQVESNGTSSLSFGSHYNDGSLSKSGGWSGTVSVKPTPIGGPPNQDQITIQQEADRQGHHEDAEQGEHANVFHDLSLSFEPDRPDEGRLRTCCAHYPGGRQAATRPSPG